MRRNKIITLFGVFIIGALVAVNASAATKTTTIRVAGMHCKMCADSIAKALKATTGVEQVEVSFEKGVALVKYDDEQVTEVKLREVINSTGYKAVEDKAASR
jgi:copper chaperone CopZ